MFEETSAVILLAVMAIVTLVLRALPFVLFNKDGKMPYVIVYLGDVLPMAVMGMLVVYCLRNITLMESPFGIPEIISCLLVVVLQKWKRSSLVSILAGTICYMVLIRVLF